MQTEKTMSELITQLKEIFKNDLESLFNYFTRRETDSKLKYWCIGQCGAGVVTENLKYYFINLVSEDMNSIYFQSMGDNKLSTVKTKTYKIDEFIFYNLVTKMSFLFSEINVPEDKTQILKDRGLEVICTGGYLNNISKTYGIGRFNNNNIKVCVSGGHKWLSAFKIGNKKVWWYLDAMRKFGSIVNNETKMEVNFVLGDKEKLKKLLTEFKVDYSVSKL
jgi:hypothetical protein